MGRLLSKEDVLAYAIASTALSTGGGGVGPSLESVAKMYDDAIAKGARPELIELSEVPDDAIVTSVVATGGGVSPEMMMRWGGRGGRLRRDLPFGRFDPEYIRDKILENDATWCPLNSWSKIPGPDFRRKAWERLKELIGGKEIFSRLFFEISPFVTRDLCYMSLEGMKAIDATCAGYRAAPEISQSGLNLADVKCTPAVITTVWGDLLILEEVLCFQRAEEIVEGIATYSGGVAGGPFALTGKEAKKGMIPGCISFTIDIGKAILKARESGDDIAEAIVDASKGRAFKLFEGKIAEYWQEPKYSFIWGMVKIKGTGKYAGHRFKAWYKNEFHISWLDDKPYVTSPDGINVIDPKTGWGLANFWPAEWEPGREVVVIGVKNDERWETPRGLKLFGPQHFFFDIEHVPIDKIYKNFE
ncbi:hypothetical protein DRO24_00030 [Candidatus Bathyarchaeota archaeon]|nr:MAG: hypothetical protein DRO24_00030 [Candidatus Bathyarchaeota archaeon]